MTRQEVPQEETGMYMTQAITTQSQGKDAVQEQVQPEADAPREAEEEANRADKVIMSMTKCIDILQIEEKRLRIKERSSAI